MFKRTFLAMVIAACAASATVGAEIVEQVLVRVNGEIITKTEFESRQVAALGNRPELAGAGPSSPELRKAVAELTPELILSAVDDLLLVQRGRESGYALGDQQFTQILENIKTTNDLHDDTKFREALRQEGLTLADLRRNLERQMLISQVQRVEILDKISITDEEARAYYQSNLKEFTAPAEVTLREILFEVANTSRGFNVAEDDEVRARAAEVRKRLLGGEPFPRLAAEYSSSGSKANGGLVGPVNVEELSPTLRDLLAGMQVGDLTEPLRTARGYQLVKLESRTDARVRSFEAARGDIGNKIGEQKLKVERDKYLDRLREQATIVWRNAELKKAYDTALSRRQTANTQAAAAASAN
jgi:peptidyl-prolyl cis-trans isomerase SurA